MQKPYRLEIYMPGSADEVFVLHESAMPFPVIQKGDIVCPGEWPGLPSTALCAVAIQHVIWKRGEAETTAWTTCVYTKEVSLTRDLLAGAP